MANDHVEHIRIVQETVWRSVLLDCMWAVSGSLQQASQSYVIPRWLHRSEEHTSELQSH